MLGNLTPEQRAEAFKKARLAREEKRKAGEQLEQDFGTDENVWRALSSKYSVRLPASYISNQEVKYLKRIATKLNVDLKEYLEDSGCKTLKELVKFNPTWPAFAEAGLFLEWYDERVKE